MTETHLNLTETTVDGPRTVRWELNAADCLELAARRVSRLGIHQAMAPYRRVRVRPGGHENLDALEVIGQHGGRLRAFLTVRAVQQRRLDVNLPSLEVAEHGIEAHGGWSCSVKGGQRSQQAESE